MADLQVDKDMLDGLKMILEDKFNLLLNTFISDSEGRKDRLIEAAGNKDFTSIRHESHGLKGSSRNIGANDFAEKCAVVEDQATREDAADLEKNVAAVEQSLALVIAELKQYLP